MSYYFFTSEQYFNKQNYRIYVQSPKDARQSVDREQNGHYSISVMIWRGVSYEGVTEAYCCEKGIKTPSQV